MQALPLEQQRALLFLKYGPLLRAGLGWRFGTARVTQRTVDRLIANEMASHLFPGEPDERVIARIA